MEPLKQLDGELRSLIKKYLDFDYTAYDMSGTIPTGKKYQTINFGNEQIDGFRGADRSHFVRALNARNARILDIGSNLGELSRIAGEGEGNFVFSLEYDPYFVRLAQLINIAADRSNVFTSVANVEIDPFPTSLDYILAFSVFRFISGRLGELAEALKPTGIMLLETHNIESAASLNGYWTALKAVFPYVAQLGTTDHGKEFEGHRVVFAVSKDRDRLWKFLFDFVPLSAGTPGLGKLSLKVSRFDFLKAISEDLQFLERARSTFVSGGDSGWVRDVQVDAVGDGALFSPDYWKCYAAGFYQFISSGAVDSQNIYISALRRALLLDAGYEVHIKAELSSEEALKEKVTRRFGSFKRMMECGGPEGYCDVPVLVLKERQTAPSPDFSVSIDGTEVFAHAIDGYHRLFDSFFLGFDTMPVSLIQYDFE